MKETMIMNVTAMAAGSFAIGIACYVTKSAWPIFGYLLIPKWDYTSEPKNREEDNE